MIDNEPFTLDLTLTAKPIPGDAPPVIRMRKALKCLLRVYGVRASWQDMPASVASNAQDNGGGIGAGDDTTSASNTPAAMAWAQRHCHGHGDLPTDSTAACAAQTQEPGKPGSKAKPCSG